MPKSSFHLLQSFNFGEIKDLAAGSIVKIQIMRTGAWNHPYYGPFEVTEQTLNNIIKNFNDNVRGIDIAVDENHEDDHKAMGWYRVLEKIDNNSLYASIELTEYGAEILSKGMYKYFSPEITREESDPETNKTITDLLIGGAFTNRPFFKNMDELKANETGGQEGGNTTFIFCEKKLMTKVKQLLAQFSEKKILDFNSKFELKQAFNELSDEEKTEVADQVDAEIAKPETEITEEKKETPVTKADDTAETVPQAQYSEALKAKDEAINAKNEAEKKLKFAEAEKTAEAFCYSEKNTKGVFNLSTQKDPLAKFMASLSDSQLSSFNELMTGIDTSVFGMFNEFGTDETVSEEDNNKAKKYHEAVEAKSKEMNISYDKAAKLVSWNEVTK